MYVIISCVSWEIDVGIECACKRITFSTKSGNVLYLRYFYEKIIGGIFEKANHSYADYPFYSYDWSFT